MCSTREKQGRIRPTAAAAALALAVVAGLGGGCFHYEPPPAEVASEPDEPMVLDEAILRRDWEPVSAYYANGDVVGGSDRKLFRADEVVVVPNDPYGEYRHVNDYGQAVAAPFLFVANVAAIPFTYLWEPPFDPVASQGEYYRPTYTGVPALAADQPLPGPVVKPPRAVQRDRDFSDRDIVPEGGYGTFSDRPRGPREEPPVEPEPMPPEEPMPGEAVPTEPVPGETPAPEQPLPAETAPEQPAPELAPTDTEPAPQDAEPVPGHAGAEAAPQREESAPAPPPPAPSRDSDSSGFGPGSGTFNK